MRGACGWTPSTLKIYTRLGVVQFSFFWIFRGLLSQGEITLFFLTKFWWIWQMFDPHGPHPLSPTGTGGVLGCLRGFVGQIISPKFLLLLKPAITEPSGNNLLFKGSLYRVSLFPLNIFEIQYHQSSPAILIRELFRHFYWTFHNYKHKLGIPEVLTGSPSTFIFSSGEIWVTAEKIGEVHASRPACCGQVIWDLLTSGFVTFVFYFWEICEETLVFWTYWIHFTVICKLTIYIKQFQRFSFVLISCICICSVYVR